MYVDVELISNNTYQNSTFTYQVPNKLKDKINVGSIVIVPFRNRDYKAIIVSTSNESLIKNPKQIKAIEISPIFRNHLKKKFGSKIELYDNDAKNLKDIINNSSIDKILLINVIYFLNPLDLYLKEFKRILDEDGIVFIAGKFEAVKTFNDNVFQNKQIKDLLKVLKKFFKVSYEFVDLGDLNSRYYAIYLKK